MPVQAFRIFIYAVLISLLLLGVPVVIRAADRPHNDYRTGYTDVSCSSGAGAACHNVSKGTFLPAPGISDSSPSNDFTSFCLSCHNSAGEAHGKNAGSASTNQYINFTGIDKTVPHSGTSHSWNGIINNAGTRVPTLPGFKTDYFGTVGAGTTHMVNWTSGGQTYYKVRCQTCHTGMFKVYASGAVTGNIDWAQCTTSDNLRFTVPPGTPTKTYLNKYVQVYRNGPATITNSRTKKQYLVSPSEYTYKNQSALIVFNTAQPVGTYIYADIHEPYLRDDNSANAVCVDCHNDRPSQSVTHSPGNGLKNGHPVSGSPLGGPSISVSYGHSYGVHTTTMLQPSGNVYLEGGQIYCTSCHKQHNAASTNGELMREATGAALCGDCHKTKMNGYSSSASLNIHNGPKHSSNNEPATDCLDCHTAHNSNNIMLIKNVINGRKVNFQSFTGARSFGNENGNSLCEACHTKTGHHRASNDTGLGHNAGKDCTSCHKHKNGFTPSGGSPPCYDCHDGRNTAPNIKALMGLGTSFNYGGLTSRHIIQFDNTSSTCLSMCHVSNHNSGSPNLKVQPEGNLCMSCHNGGTGTTSRGKSINVATHFASSLHNFSTTVQDEFGLFQYKGNCTKCHLPHGSNNYPNLRQANDQNLCFNCHGSGSSIAVDIQSRWTANPASNKGHYDYANQKQLNCVTCHGPHGSTNRKMIKDSLVTNVTSYQSSYKICLACHSGNGGSAYNVMSNAPGSYGPNFSATSVHQFGLNVAVGGRTYDLTCVGCHDPHDTKNARLLRRQITFTGMTGSVGAVMVNVSAVVSTGDGISSYSNGWSNYCLACHTSFSETESQSPFIRHPIRLSPRLASSTSASTSTYYPYTSGSNIGVLPLESGKVACITCHYAHGSPQPKLRRMKNATTPENRLCLQCHDKSKFLRPGQEGTHGGFILNQGRCSDCHNMHDYGNKRLLKVATETDLCQNCHSAGGISKYKVWKPITTMDPSWLRGTGGTFGNFSEVRGGTAPSMHLINEEYLSAPGGVTTQHRCGSCHNPHGSPNYRILRTAINNVTGIAVYAKRDEQDNFIGYSSGIVKFCTACHMKYKETKDGGNDWIRHPVNVSLDDYTSERNAYLNNTSYTPKVELESGKRVVCLSCHYAHGSSQNANLKYPGGRTVNTCKTCHGMNFNVGQPGSHAGYTQDNGTCSDCHSMHKSTNAKLLNYTTDTGVCVQCHNGPNPAMGSKVSHLVVWKGNTFDSPTSWLNTGGSFGAYNAATGGTAPSMHPINASAAIAPGGGPAGTGLATAVRCGTCHNTHGSPNYRLLKTSLNGTANIAVTGTMDSRGNTIAHVSGMSNFCAACHTVYADAGTGADGYMRHPVNVSLNPQQLDAYNHFNGSKYLPLEANNKVTCITCHCAHGSPNPKMLRLTVPQLCQTCHAKGLDPTNGYAQVSHTHGGFTGNNGNCFACHYVHRRYDSLTSTVLNRKMLRDSDESHLCYGCHAQDGANHSSYPSAPITWKGDKPANPGDWDGTAGSFGAFYNATTGGSAPSHHMINKTDSPAPGGNTSTHHCGTCHNPHGNDNYRILRDDVNGQPSRTITVNATTDANGKTVYINGISNFCVSCHTQYGVIGSGVNGYQRHPVTVNGTIKGNTFNSTISLSRKEWLNLSTSSTLPKAQVENGNVMCLSCHFAHGSPSYKMLRMPSITSSQSVICQQCHKKGYNAAGQQYQHTHGGFAGNNANCIVCHSVHADNNNKLLVESKEENLCRNCHSGLANFTSFKGRNPEVKLTAPSRYNVFTTVGNSFGNYSVGKGIVSHHALDVYTTAPGGIAVNLRCGVCHSPHGEDNYVMLRSSFQGATGIKVFGHLSSSINTEFNTYSSGFGKFCSVCHTRLTNCGGNPWTRHPVDFQLQNGQLHNWSTTKIKPRVPIESAQRKVTCITCHNSHGSKNYNLMRLPGNGMCQQCHNR